MEFNIDELLAQAPDLIIGYGGKIVVALLIFFIGKWVARAISKIFEKMMTARNIDVIVSKFVGNLVYGALFAFVAIAALGHLGIQTASFVAIVGAAGLAVGLALQGSLSNFAAGVLMILFRPFKVGDVVQAGGETGIVEEVAIFSTTMRTPDNKVIIIPNSNIMGGNITNFSARDTRRVDLVIGVSYDADIRQVQQELEAILAANEKVLDDPAPAVALAALADSSVNFNVRPWVKSEDYWAVYSEVQAAVKLRFDELGISIPFPQVEMHIVKPET